MRAKKRVGVALALVVVLLAPGAWGEPSATERETARTLLLSGREKRKSGKLKEAIADFERAHGIMHVPTTGLDLGKAQEAVGLLVEARASYLDAAHHSPSADEPRAFTRARQEAKQLADALAPRLATLTVVVTSGARVKIDDAELAAPSVGAPLKVNPGKHQVSASLGPDEKRTVVSLAEGEARTLELPLTEAAPGESGTSGRPVDRDKPIEPDDPSPTVTKLNPLVWVGAATAGVGLAVGATTGLLAFGVKKSVVSRCDDGLRCPPETHSDIDRGEALGTVSTISFVVMGIGGLVIAYGLLNPVQVKTPVTSGLHVSPGPLGLTGTF